MFQVTLHFYNNFFTSPSNIVKIKHICGSKRSKTDIKEHFGDFLFILKLYLIKQINICLHVRKRFLQYIVVMYNPGKWRFIWSWAESTFWGFSEGKSSQWHHRLQGGIGQKRFQAYSFSWNLGCSIFYYLLAMKD